MKAEARWSSVARNRLLTAAESFIPRKMNFRPIADAMRMPILGYFLVIGAILFAAIVVVGSELESEPLPVSQTIGVPPPFRASVEPSADSM